MSNHMPILVEDRNTFEQWRLATNQIVKRLNLLYNVDNTLRIQGSAIFRDDISVGRNLNVTGFANISKNLTVDGDLVIKGTTTTVNSEIVTMGDKIITLNWSEDNPNYYDSKLISGLEVNLGTDDSNLFAAGLTTIQEFLYNSEKNETTFYLQDKLHISVPGVEDENSNSSSESKEWSKKIEDYSGELTIVFPVGEIKHNFVIKEIQEGYNEDNSPDFNPVVIVEGNAAFISESTNEPIEFEIYNSKRQFYWDEENAKWVLKGAIQIQGDVEAEDGFFERISIAVGEEHRNLNDDDFLSIVVDYKEISNPLIVKTTESEKVGGFLWDVDEDTPDNNKRLKLELTDGLPIHQSSTKILLDPNGNSYIMESLGIGTQNPSVKLDVIGDVKASARFGSGDGTVGNPAYHFNSDTGAGMYLIDTGKLSLATGGSDRITIDADGKVGIGTTSPVGSLEVITDGDGTEDGIILRSSSTGGRTLQLWATGDKAHIGAGDGTQDLILNHAGGNVGIGTTNPEAPLEVRKNDSNPNLLLRSLSNTDPTLSFLSDSKQFTIGIDDTNNSLVFSEGSVLGSSDRMTIDSSGKVGIGTNIPVAKLSLFEPSENVSLSLQTSNKSRWWITADGDSETTNALRIGGTGTSEPSQGSININSSGKIGIGTNATPHKLTVLGDLGVGDSLSGSTLDGIVFSSTSTSGYHNTIKHTNTGLEFDNTATIDRNYSFLGGSVGIGTTSPDSLFEVEKNNNIAYDATDDSGQRDGTATIQISNQDGTVGSFSQLLFDTAGTSQSIARIAAVRVGNGSNDLAFALEHGDTKHEAMRIKSVGNVGIGTASPSQKLHIVNEDGASYAFLDSYRENLYGGGIQLSHARGTADNPKNLEDDDILGLLAFNAFDSSSNSFDTSSQISARATANHTSTSRPSNLVFETTPLNSIYPVWRMLIDSDGDVGIGTANPREKLDVNGAIVVGTSLNFTPQSGIGGSIVYDGSTFWGHNGLEWKNLFTGAVLDPDNNSDAGLLSWNRYMRSETYGISVTDGPGTDIFATQTWWDVGIGLENPTTKLHVVQDLPDPSKSWYTNESFYDTITTRYIATLENKNTTGNGLQILCNTTDSNINIFRCVNDSPTYDPLSGISTGTEIFVVKGDGKVGIGVSSPTAPLDVDSDSTAVGIAIRARVGTDYSNINFRNDAGSSTLAAIGAAGDNFRIFTGSDLTNERLRIDGNGNVGIGTTSPKINTWANLSLTIQSDDSINSSPAILELDGNVISGTDNVISGITFHNKAVGGTGSRRVAQITASTNDPYNKNAGNLDFWTTGTSGTITRKMRILDNGNVGIGVTNPKQNLEVGGVIKIGYTQDDGHADLAGCIRWNATRGLLEGNDGTTNWKDANDQNTGWFAIGKPDWERNDSTESIFYRVDPLSGKDGYVGIGTKEPERYLDINLEGNWAVNEYAARIRNTHTTGSGLQVVCDQTTSSDSYIFACEKSSTTSPQYPFVVKGNGNVGIGTPTPSSPLHIKSATDQILKLQTTDQVTNGPLYMGFYNNGDGQKGWFGYGSGLNEDISIWNKESGSVKFSTSDEIRMTITSSGRVGIGTTIPTEKLHVDGGSLRVDIGTTPDSAAIFSGGGSNLHIDLDTGYTTFRNTAGSTSNEGFRFKASSTGNDLVTIRNDGNVGIGTSAPSEKLEVDGNIKSSGKIGIGDFSGSAITENLEIRSTSYGDNYLKIKSTSQVESPNIDFCGIKLERKCQNTRLGDGWIDRGYELQHHRNGDLRLLQDGSDEIYRFDDSDLRHQFSGDVWFTNLTESFGMLVNGNIIAVGKITAGGDIESTSDISIKENLEIIENPIEKIKELNGYTYNKNGEEKRSAGLIAQEVEKVLPEVVSENSDGIKSLAYGNIVALLVETVKEQQKQIDELKQQISNK